ncbi:unnamed protein product [Hymenolepis diminuta]|uniref:Uncharacterized protein n=1 Tax=Hymenolepis diminuta TaxID=6216 RepID=A0A564YGC0_HYMDI|nr:unnamed protein product [Hymenolepis diminuta]
MDDKCKQLEKLRLVKPVSLANGTVSKTVAQNAGEAAPSFFRILYALKPTLLGLTLILVFQDLSEKFLIES